MGKLTIEKWQCDRCGKIEDEPPRQAETFNVRASHELEWAGGVMFEWKEMCPDCNKDVGNDLGIMSAKAKAARLALKEK